MQTAHQVTLDTFFISLGNQVLHSVNAYHIQIPNLLLVVIVGVYIGILIFLIRKIIQFRNIFSEEQIFLELTPPAFTKKDAYTTQQLFLVLHDIGRQFTYFDRLLSRKMLFSLR